MKVKELIEFLSKEDPELDVLYSLHSDYSELEAIDIAIVQLIDRGHYKERYYPHQHKLLPDLTAYLLFPGN